MALFIWDKDKKKPILLGKERDGIIPIPMISKESMYPETTEGERENNFQHVERRPGRPRKQETNEKMIEF